MSICEEKFDLILPNEFGRQYTKRYKQYLYSDVPGEDGIPGWELNNYGCGVASMATIISSLGYDLDPIKIAKLMLLDEAGNHLDFHTNRLKGRQGLTAISFLYLLQEVIKKKLCELEYEIVKLSYEYPELKKAQIIDMIKNEYMALILVAPGAGSPKTFSDYRHYIAVTSVNDYNNEFYVANPNYQGNGQIDTTYPYENIIANMGPNPGHFLMVKNRSLTLTLK